MILVAHCPQWSIADSEFLKNTTAGDKSRKERIQQDVADGNITAFFIWIKMHVKIIESAPWLRVYREYTVHVYLFPRVYRIRWPKPTSISQRHEHSFNTTQ